MIPCKERGALNRHRHPDGHTARRGVTLIFAGVTAVMVLTVSLSFYFTPASAGAIFTAPLCGGGSPPDYGFTLADQAPGSICAFFSDMGTHYYSNPQANEMRLVTCLRFPKVCQFGVKLEQ